MLYYLSQKTPFLGVWRNRACNRQTDYLAICIKSDSIISLNSVKTDCDSRVKVLKYLMNG